MDDETNCTLLFAQGGMEMAEDMPNEPLQLLTFVLYIVLMIYFLSSCLLMFHRKHLFPICMRSPMLVSVQASGSMLLLSAAILRDGMKRTEFPCEVLLIGSSGYVPLFVVSMTIMLAQMHNRLKLAKAMADFTITEVDLCLDRLRKRIHRAGKWNEIRLLGISIAITAGILVYVLIRYPYYLARCKGCMANRTANYLFYTYALILIIPSLYLLRKMRFEEDPIGARHEVFHVLKVSFLAAVMWMTLDRVNHSEFNNTWILVANSIHAHQVFCIRPILRTFVDHKTAYRKRKRKRAKSLRASRKNTVVPSQQSTSVRQDDRIGLDVLLSTDIGMTAFQKHLAQEFNVENILFWRSASQWREMYFDAPSETTRNAVARNIFAAFIPDCARMQVNLHSGQRLALETAFKDETTSYLQEVFDEAIEEIFNLMKRDGFQRFQETADYPKICQKVEEELYNKVY